MGLSHRARAGISTALAVTLVALSSSDAAADQVRATEWWLNALQIPDAWTITRGSGVTVAVLDTGVSPVQPDLAGSVVSGPDFTGSGRTRGERYWGRHGTQVAGLIAAHGHGSGGSEGLIGVAPQARILSVRVTLESNDPRLGTPAIASRLPAAIARGIDYAASHGAGVIDLPLDPATRPGAPGSGGSRAEQSAIKNALAKNIVLVAPAGDTGARPGVVNYPAAYPGVISVGAFGPRFGRAGFSSRERVTLSGPGIDILTADSHGYARLASTSAASAIVAGIAALIRAKFPTLTPDQVTAALTASAAHHSPRVMSVSSDTSPINAARALALAGHIAATASPKTQAHGQGNSAASAGSASSGLGHKQLTYILIALGALALLGALFGMVFGFRALRRRRAKAARFAEIRAAAQLPRTPRGQPASRAGQGQQSAAASPPARPGGTEPPAVGAGFVGAGAGPRLAIPGGPGYLGAPPATAATAMPPAPAGVAPGSPFTGSARADSPFTGPARADSPFTGPGPADSPFTGPEPTDSPFTGPGPFGGSGPADSPFAGPGPSDSPFAGPLPSWAMPSSDPVPGVPGAQALSTPRNPWQPVPLSPKAFPGGVPAAAAAFGVGPGPAAPPQPNLPAPPPSSFAAPPPPNLTAPPQPSFAAPPQPNLPAPSAPAQAAGGAAARAEEESRHGGPGAQLSRSLSEGPRVVGQPPWEPAPQPDGELPWTKDPEQSPASASDLPPRDTAHDQAAGWASTAPGLNDDAIRLAGKLSEGQGRAQGDRPIYVWNPVTGPASARPSTPAQPRPLGTPLLDDTSGPRATPPWEILSRPDEQRGAGKPADLRNAAKPADQRGDRALPLLPSPDRSGPAPQAPPSPVTDSQRLGNLPRSPLPEPPPWPSGFGSTPAAERAPSRPGAAAADPDAGPLPVRKPGDSLSGILGQPGDSQSRFVWKTSTDVFTPAAGKASPPSGEPLRGPTGRATINQPPAAIPDAPVDSTETLPAVPDDEN
ncbi:MAG TPA: S8 family serine peptidase [Streptosporangiaceae bacterium]|nr:S8 family serine peptidase [Streptosporangiaceae bacterium]